ncbi:MAG TPA: nuclear transport factor 2 family protein [Streptosporangiaceae bacterium]
MTSASPATPHQVFARMQCAWLAQKGFEADQLADDVVIEGPFAPPGHPRRVEGRDRVLAHYGPQWAVFPARFDEVRNVVIHDTANPEVIVVEYELAGTVLATGRQASAPFIGILRARDGKIVLWREYQNVLAIAHALGQLPALLEDAARQPDTGCESLNG